MVKLLDFGVARMREAGGEATRAGTALGTPSFMAPEQAMGLADGVDGRADLFSIGATLYAMLERPAPPPGPHRQRGVHPRRDHPRALRRPRRARAPGRGHRARRQGPRLGPAQPLRDRRGDARRVPAAPRQARRRRPRPARGRQGQSAARKLLEEKARKAERPRPPRRRQSSRRWRRRSSRTSRPTTPAVQRLVDVFRAWERLLPAIRHYGWAHPEADAKLRATYQKVIEALRADPNAVWWHALPLRLRPPRARRSGSRPRRSTLVPYNLFAAGIRKVYLSPGFSEDELRALCEVMMLDPAVDLAPEDDVAAALWEKRLEHVRYDAINVFAEGDAADREAFWAEADDVEALARKAATEEKANRAEAAAMAIETDAAALRAARQAASVLALDPVTKKALASQLGMSPERWSERFIDVITDAFQDARRRGDLPLVTEPLDAPPATSSSSAASAWRSRPSTPSPRPSRRTRRSRRRRPAEGRARARHVLARDPAHPRARGARRRARPPTPPEPRRDPASTPSGSSPTRSPSTSTRSRVRSSPWCPRSGPTYLATILDLVPASRRTRGCGRRSSPTSSAASPAARARWSTAS